MGSSHGRAWLAAEKGKLLVRLKRMQQTQQINRHEVDLELMDEIQAVKTQFNELDHVANLWDRGEVTQYDTALNQYENRYGRSNERSRGNSNLQHSVR